MSGYDPYAPPRGGPLPAPVARPPLPQGIRRHGLDLAGYRERVARALRARITRGIVIGIGYFLFLVFGASFPAGSLYVAVPVWCTVIGASYLLARARMRKLEPSVMQGFELLVSPRVLRRTAYGLRPAEIVLPEVTSIVEVPEGLSFVSRQPTRRLFVVRSVERFAELRDDVRTWAPIEARAGFSGYLRRLSHLSGERTRDPIDGAVASDPTLRGELEAVRTLAMPFDPRAFRARRRPLKVLVVLWMLLIVLFLAIWQLLSPGDTPRRHPPRRGSETTI